MTTPDATLEVTAPTPFASTPLVSTPTPIPAPKAPTPPGGGLLFTHLIQIGCGGTGTWLAEGMVRLFQFHKSGSSMKKYVFIDGDHFEAKNQERQLFAREFIGQNKPDAIKKRLDFLSDDELAEKVIPISDYINGTKFLSLLAGLDILDAEKPEEVNPLVILAVDNDATRKEILDTLSEADIKNYVVLSPGNDYDNGRCTVEMRRDGKKITMPLQERYENIREPGDKVPEGCANATPSAPQLILANMWSAGVTLATIRNMIDGYAWYDEVVFDVTNMKMLASGAAVMGKTKKEISKAKKAEEEEKKNAAIAKAQAATGVTGAEVESGAEVAVEGETLVTVAATTT